MGFKTITVTEEAYKMLAREKKEGESFSEVIKRLTKQRGRLSDSLGAWKLSDQGAREIFASLRRHWKESTRRLQMTTDELQKLKQEFSKMTPQERAPIAKAMLEGAVRCARRKQKATVRSARHN